jgi:hypothetical protein
MTVTEWSPAGPPLTPNLTYLRNEHEYPNSFFSALGAAKRNPLDNSSELLQ